MIRTQYFATEKLAKFISETHYGHIPEEARKEVKKAILDWLGVTLVGSREPVVQKVIEYSRRLQAIYDSSVIGSNLQTSAELAAWINGIAGHALDYDDTFAGRDYNIHPTVPVLPAGDGSVRSEPSPDAAAVAKDEAGAGDGGSPH